MSDYNAQITYATDGSQTTFSFPFDYLRKTFIYCTSNGVALVYGTHYTVLDKEVEFASAPAAGTLRIQRRTSTDPLVSWADASVLRALDLTVFEVQCLHLAEETADAVKTDTADLAEEAAASAGAAASSASEAAASAGAAASSASEAAASAGAAASSASEAAASAGAAAAEVATAIANIKPPPGLTNYIASGRKFTVGADLNLSISAGVDSISGITVEREVGTIALHPRRAQLLYDTKAGTTGIIDATFPTADAGTVCRWDLSNWDGVSQIPSTAGANNLIPNGALTREVGWAGDYAIKGNGSSGYLVSANSTGFPTGNNPVELIIPTTYAKGNADYTLIGGYGVNSANGFYIYTAADNQIYIAAGGNIPTGFFPDETKYVFTLSHDGTTLRLRANGQVVYSAPATLNITATPLSIFRNGVLTGYYKGVIDYIELRNAPCTAAEIAAISNALLLPCRYYPSPAINEYTDICSVLPADAISLGFVRTGTTAPLESNGIDYKYGRREGAVGGNRRVFLGRVYASGTGTPVPFINPFGTRKFHPRFTWAADSEGTGECGVAAPYVYIIGDPNPDKIIVYCSATGWANVAFSWKTSGHIGCYAEVFD
ncbi:phage tail fiber protein [Anaeroselena agilis]|uniref:Phage tail fiber protein n=1 Tax=Anaeroselena agilis TaxID=3063788 RepID=A0ABU3NV25_9FIRM|nr:phage tail fiber protein [Selenomonadales bacterium 4137-cl]